MPGDEESEKIRRETLRASREWGPALQLIDRIEAGQITLSLSEYTEIPKNFFSIWDILRKEREEEKEKKRTMKR